MAKHKSNEMMINTVLESLRVKTTANMKITSMRKVAIITGGEKHQKVFLFSRMDTSYLSVRKKASAYFSSCDESVRDQAQNSVLLHAILFRIPAFSGHRHLESVPASDVGKS